MGKKTSVYVIAGDTGPVVRPAAQSKSEGPSTDPREEMRLAVALEVVRMDIGNAPGVHVARRDQPLGDQLAQPRGGAGVEFVAVGARHHPSASSYCACRWSSLPRAAQSSKCGPG